MKLYEYRSKLLEVSEDDSFSLPHPEWYDRIRFKREILAQHHLFKLGNTNSYIENKDASERFKLDYKA